MRFSVSLYPAPQGKDATSWKLKQLRLLIYNLTAFFFFAFHEGYYLFGSTKRATLFMQNFCLVSSSYEQSIIRQNLVFFIKLGSKLCTSWFTLLFYLLFACYTRNFGLISRVQPHSPDDNHYPLSTFDPQDHQEPLNKLGSASLVIIIVIFVIIIITIILLLL